MTLQIYLLFLELTNFCKFFYVNFYYIKQQISNMDAVSFVDV